MGIRKTRLIALAVALLVVGTVGGALMTGPTKATDVPTAAQPTREDSYSTLLRASRGGEVRSVLLDAGTATAEVAYRDGTSADVQLPTDNTALLDELAASGAYVAIDGHAPAVEASGGGSSTLHALLPTLLLVVLLGGCFWWIRRRANAMN